MSEGLAALRRFRDGTLRGGLALSDRSTRCESTGPSGFRGSTCRSRPRSAADLPDSDDLLMTFLQTGQDRTSEGRRLSKSPRTCREQVGAAGRTCSLRSPPRRATGPADGRNCRAPVENGAKTPGGPICFLVFPAARPHQDPTDATNESNRREHNTRGGQRRGGPTGRRGGQGAGGGLVGNGRHCRPHRRRRGNARRPPSPAVHTGVCRTETYPKATQTPPATPQARPVAGPTSL